MAALSGITECIYCGNRSLTPTVAHEKLVVGGHEFRCGFDAKACMQCGRFVGVEGTDLQTFETRVAKTLALARDNSPEAISIMVRVADMSSEQLAELFGISRDEIHAGAGGPTAIDSRAFDLLALIVLEKADGQGSVIERLRMLRRVKPLAEVIEIRLR